ncbi:MAG: hypothetical protein GY796_04230 [Chloroflexi bacterium]|nr:hypothetical protein [Chloroflexota bacterium]
MKKLITSKQQDPIIDLYQQQMKEAAEKPWLASLMLQRAKRLFERFAMYYKQLANLSRQTQHRLQKKLSLSLAGVALLLALSHAPRVHASTISVDGVTCTLNEAIQSANTDTAVGGCTAGSGSDILDLQNSIVLSVDTTQVYSIITIEGNGYTIDGNDNHIFPITSGGQLTINEATLTGSSKSRGGAIHNDRSMVTLNYSTVSGNSAVLAGGGIYSYDGTVTLNHSTINGNLVSHSSVGDGGGISIYEGTLMLNNSTVSGNSANDEGGGIYIRNGALTLNNSTVSGNTAYNGGGIYSYSVYANPVTLNNSTVSGNYASNDGGGIYAYYGMITLNRSVISGNNAANNGDEIYDKSGHLTGNNYNVIGYDGLARTYGFTPTTAPYGTDVIPAGPLNTVLEGLADNDGPTLTHALADVSPAIDLILTSNNACDPGVSTDQRGAVRADGVNRGGSDCDAGAFEYASDQTPTAVTLESLSASTTTPTGVAVLTGLLASLGVGGLLRRRRAQ